MPIAPYSRRMPALAELTLVPSQPAVGHSVRPGGFDPESLNLVFLVCAEVALEPEPFGLVVVVALPGEDVRAGPVEEPAVVGNHHRAAGEFLQGVLERAQGLDVQVVGRLVQQDEVAAL